MKSCRILILCGTIVIVNIKVVAEESFRESIWCKEYLRGIKSEVRSQNIRLSEKKSDYSIIIGSSTGWLSEQNISRQTVFITPDIFDVQGVASCVSVNFQMAMQKIYSYLQGGKKHKPLLLGVNPSSSGDSMKKRSFKKIFPQGSIVENKGDVSQMIKDAAFEIDEADSIICCNSMVAVFLSSSLSCEKERPWILTFGRSSLARMVHTPITSVDCDYESVGRTAVKTCMLLEKNRHLSSITMTVEAQILPDASTEYFEVPEDLRFDRKSQHGSVDTFFCDSEMKVLFDLENMLSHCLSVDFEILKALQKKVPYEKLSEQLNMSVNTLKYRIRRMLILAQCSSRKELLNLLQSYPLSFDLKNDNL